jgi:hypothetical protein
VIDSCAPTLYLVKTFLSIMADIMTFKPSTDRRNKIETEGPPVSDPFEGGIP